MAHENATEGAHGGQRRERFGLELSADGERSIFAEGRMVFEPLAQLQPAPDDSGGGAVCGLGVATGAVVPIDAIQALALGAAHPFTDRAQGRAETPGHPTERSATTNGGDQETTRARSSRSFMALV